jgi:hypothetical protein
MLRSLSIVLAAASLFVSSSFTNTTNTEFVIVQKGKATVLSYPSSTVELEKKEFSLIFSQPPYNEDKNEFHSTQIALTLDKNDLDKIKEGMQVSDIECFSPGTGFASAGTYKSSIINTKENVGHHYIIYEMSGVHRANLMGEKEGMLKLAHKINSFTMDGKTIKIKNTPFPELYMIIVSDRNLNKTVDKDEYRLLTIRFK